MKATYLTLLALPLALFSCKKSDPQVPNAPAAHTATQGGDLQPVNLDSLKTPQALVNALGDQLVHMAGLTSTVKDVESARAAAAQMKVATENIQKIIPKLKDAKPLSEEERKNLSTALDERMEKVMAKVTGPDPSGLEPDEIQKISEILKNAGAAFQAEMQKHSAFMESYFGK